MSFVPSDSHSATWLSRLLDIIGGAPAEAPDPNSALSAYLNGHGTPPQRRGLFGGDYLRYMAARDAGSQLASAPGAANGQTMPRSEFFGTNSRPALNDAVLRASDPPMQLYQASAPQQVSTVAAASAPPVDPRRTDVFQPGPDGKLHPVPGWHTTGPFDFAEWGRNIDWPGVGWDLATDVLGALGAGVELPLTAWKAAQIAGRLATPAVGIEKSVHEKMERERRR